MRPAWPWVLVSSCDAEAAFVVTMLVSTNTLWVEEACSKSDCVSDRSLTKLLSACSVIAIHSWQPVQCGSRMVNQSKSQHGHVRSRTSWNDRLMVVGVGRMTVSKEGPAHRGNSQLD